MLYSTQKNMSTEKSEILLISLRDSYLYRRTLGYMQSLQVDSTALHLGGFNTASGIGLHAIAADTITAITSMRVNTASGIGLHAMYP